MYMAGFEKHQIEAFLEFLVNIKDYLEEFLVFVMLVWLSDCVLEGFLVFKRLWNWEMQPCVDRAFV